MKKPVLILLCALALAGAGAQERVLFIGNSLTYFNDMPHLFERIAADKGHEVEARSFTLGGTGLVELAATSEVQRLIREERWDKVVLQPGSSESAGLSRSTGEMARAILQFLETLRAMSPDAKVCLYEISNGVTPGNGSGDYATYLYSQQRIRDTVLRMAALAGLPMAPAGECFRHHYAVHHDLMLHSAFNDVHPNLAGSYLVACALFETLFEEPVMPCRFHASLDAGQADYLQEVADSVVLPRREEWLMGPGSEDDPSDVGLQPVAQRRLQVYPNPSTGLVHVDTCGEVLLFDLKGTATRTEAKGGQIDLSHLVPGVYILQAGNRRQRLILSDH
ncbi:MAG: T9SS type A sorting domain-containing protein [Bacteroidales bacterium]|nr:T9SS type A sorting domain-containing protein [Bacteroidales bacterium]